MIGTALAFLSWLLGCAAPADSRAGRLEILQPARYLSASGEFALEVDPSSPSGRAEASYVLTHRGEVVWASRMPFSLWEAAVSDRGAVAGFSYSHGPDGRAESTFRVLLLDPSGAPLRDDVHTRRSCRGLAIPWSGGLFVQDELDRAVFRVRDDDALDASEAWWTYELSTGVECSKLRPIQMLFPRGASKYSGHAFGLPGTPLSLVQWNPGGDDAAFSLLDPAWNEVWKLDLPEDYKLPGDEGSALRVEVAKKGAILGVSTAGRFELRVSKGMERVGYLAEYEQSKDRWIVREISRKPFEREVPHWPEGIPEIHLQHLSSILLGRPGESFPGPIRDIEEFALLADGGIEFVRRESGPVTFSILRVDRAGRLVREQLFDGFDRSNTTLHWARLASGGWIVVSDRMIVAGSRAAMVDPGTGRISVIPGFQHSVYEGIDPTPGGGFVLLGRASLCCFDPAGNLMWKLAEYPSRACTVTSEGILMVLTNRGSLRSFDLDGTPLGERDLARELGADHLDNVLSDADGGVIAYGSYPLAKDRLKAPAIWRLGRDGRTLAHLELSDPEKLTSGNLERSLRVAPDGGMWSTDGYVFAEIDDDGQVCRIVGEQPRDDQISAPGAAFVDNHGRILVQDERTADVHVFDSAGKPLLVARALAEDVASASSIRRLGVSANGSLLVEQRFRSSQYLLFSSDGERHGIRELDCELVTCCPDREEYWGMRGHQLLRFDSDATIVGVIDRRPDRWFFDEVAEVAVAPDGRIAVVDDAGLALFDCEGAPVKAIRLPADFHMWKLAYSGRWVAAGGSLPEILLVDTAGETCFRWTVDVRTIPRSEWHFGFSPDGAELWMIEKTAMGLHRYALP